MTELSGQVTDGGTSVSGAQVFVVDTNGSANPADWTVAGGATTDVNGEWSVIGLASGATERYHAVVQYEDGGGFYNAKSLPYLSTPFAIPDSGDLQAHYDWTQASGTSSVADQTSNGHDLTGSYSGPTATINGNQAGEFDGADDYLDVSFGTTLSQPTHFFIVAQMTASPNEFNEIITGDDTTDRQAIAGDNDANGDDWTLFAGTRLNSGLTFDETPHIISGLFDGTNSVLRLDGTQIASGDAGANSLSGLTVGSHPFQFNYTAVNVGESLLYPMDKSGVQSDVESYLSNKWGITI